MKKIKKDDLVKVKGGISGWAILGIASLISFISGIIDGIARPGKCN